MYTDVFYTVWVSWQSFSVRKSAELPKAKIQALALLFPCRKEAMNNLHLCPCGSNLPYTTCCLPILNDHHKATTAEMLMRSRYTAFVERHENHILASWHQTNRPGELNFENHPVVWLGLEIHGTLGGLEQDSTGSVDFTSTYLENGQISILRENSEFVREDGLWYYLRGECKVRRQKVERNGPCPCGSGKKFKRCCLVNTPVN